jgi:bifunctional DNA-binding transcriptional regulator/antitoxin component of YhaV-PrlF toxin-antitoxin module
MRFHATIRLDGKTATGIEVPADVLAALGPGKRPKVQVTINGYTYPSTVGSMGGRSLIPVSAEVRAKAGVAAGDAVEVDVVADTQPRTVEVPEDLAAALDRAPAASRAFEQLSYSGQRRHVLAVEQAKTAETRQRRIDKAVAELSAAPTQR